MKTKLIFLFLIIAQLSISQEFTVTNPVRFLALGDSYTIGQSVTSNDSWPAQFADYLSSIDVQVDSLKIIAQTGWTTSKLISRIESEEPLEGFNLVGLLIGVNNQYQNKDIQLYKDEFKELLSTAVKIAGNKDRVFVLSIPDYGYTPFGQNNQEQISKEIDDYNAINEQITTNMGVVYFNITEISRQGIEQPELVANDGLHPSGAMYKLWVDELAKGFNVVDAPLVDVPVVTTNIEESLPDKLKVLINDETGQVSFLLENSSAFPIKTLTIYTLRGNKIIQNDMGSSIDIKLKNKGVFLYTIHQQNTILYRGKFVF